MGLQHGLTVRSCLPTAVLLVCVVLFAAKGSSPAAAQEGAEENGPDREQLEAEFKELLDGSTLVGHFTVTGRDGVEPKEERYHLQSVEKLPNEKWLFRSRIRYGDHDVTVPLPLPVEWAGDTPVIVVDKVQVPGLGTFDARVMFFAGHYAGYWSGGDHGGHLFGVIEREADDQEDDADDAEESRD